MRFSPYAYGGPPTGSRRLAEGYRLGQGGGAVWGQPQAHDGVAMNTIAKVTIIAVIVFFLVLALSALWLQ